MTKQSAGILLYRNTPQGYEVLIVHPGGPFWAERDEGSWSIPKGEFTDDEEPLVAAKREFTEEIGTAPPQGDYADLGEEKQSSGKVVRVFALKSDFNLEKFSSNMFHMEWPPKSGKQQEFPENDKAAWTPIATARQKLVKGQVPFIEKLAAQLGADLSGPQATLF
ncbi:MAG TPA: NUDIX domain-containing protein [Patescibacteria group bacterium]|nr:NUDIX domain-containing protein [Patescibacteria group bacterium]